MAVAGFMFVQHCKRVRVAARMQGSRWLVYSTEVIASPPTDTLPFWRCFFYHARRSNA
jgi:hypothetical protein